MSPRPSSVGSALREMKRRHVFRVAILYGVVGFGILEAAELVLPRLGLDDWTVQLVLGLLILGLPLALFLAWAYELTPEGIVREEADASPDPDHEYVGDGLTEEIITDPSRIRIAVLPLANTHPDRDEDYFADGMTEELISVISRIHGLDVIARTSVMAYRDTRKPVSEIGRELAVGTVLEGSVRKAGDQLRITVQLIDVRTQGHLWSGDYDREMREIFAVQSEIARSVAGALEVTLLGAEGRRVDRSPTENLEAYDLYLLGRHHLNKRTDSSIRRAVEHFDRAVALDPAFAGAYAGLADAYALAGVGYASIPDALTRAKEVALRAVELDDGLADAHTSLGYAALLSEWDWRTAERELTRAVTLVPSDARAHQWLAHVAVARRRYEEAEERVNRARALDPLSVVIQNEAGWPRHYMGDLEGAARCYRRASSMEPSFAMPHYNLGAVFEAQGQRERAIESYRRAVDLSDRTPLIVSALAAALAREGATEEARALLAELEEGTAEGADLWIWQVPVHDALGQHEEALDALERALEGREPGVIFLGTVHYPLSPALMDRPRYRAVAETVEERFGHGEGPGG